ncbi:DNA-binding transcriptional regulator, XRE-family HTH domain [Carnobacterium iners]|uniref:DNA-binding transcriptional regulator, XRE-family HTH domain n=1 Tax=Carnobacterium iners TaxID=1073423 RepID=A0A1X7MQB7_9LACT|nr:helix-turn-helix transcriptional regulator [Carnobacterium iners]SEL23913.1 DNA-binding transcriptional regulator, XRE-family HTH domain [Carnobacterium iners]SMH27002.1 DNA-binding transcriptional regulator, XRE-family HTH domain [Carnobacterium iners]
MELQTILKQKRNELQLTQEEVAEKIHVSRQTISNWENGRNLPDLSSLILISEIYAVSLDELIKGAPKMVKQLDKKIKKGHYFIGVSILSSLFIALTLSYLVSPGELSAAILFFGTIIIVFLLALLLMLMGILSILKTVQDNR